MTKQLFTLVILLLGSILLYTLSILSPSSAGDHKLYPMYHYDEIYSANYMSPVYQHGDFNADWLVNITDVICLINYLFKGGSPPSIYKPIPPDYPGEDSTDCLIVQRHGDANNDCHITISDVIYLINYLYKGGPDIMWPDPYLCDCNLPQFP
ncbi:MAG: hypothetical protein Q8O10_00405 [candidate division Zixibacteria bacterium]|nr:hypothetical protein [candidate division Zixibacteria bacterium]